MDCSANTQQVGYTADDHKYVVPPVPDKPLHTNTADVSEQGDIPITGIEEAVDRLNREAEFCPECRGHGIHNPACPNVAWLCADCGSELGECGIATWHEDTCDACGKTAAVTEVRDFTSRARVERPHLSSVFAGYPTEQLEDNEGILTVAERHMDAAQALMALASSRLADSLEHDADVVNEDGIIPLAMCEEMVRERRRETKRMMSPLRAYQPVSSEQRDSQPGNGDAPANIPLSMQERVFDLTALDAIDAAHDMLVGDAEIIDLARERLRSGFKTYGSQMYEWDAETRRRNVLEELADAIAYLTSGPIA